MLLHGGMGWHLSTSATHHNFDDENLVEEELAELSQELEEVQWMGVADSAAAASLSRGMLRQPRSHMADHWSFEMSLVIVGALMGVALYFWLG